MKQRFLFGGISALGLAAASVWQLAAAPAYAAYTYNVEQIAPSFASNLTMQQIAAILNEARRHAIRAGGLVVA
jgi:hypothetical protein